MSLVRLLATGKSVTGVRKGVSPYRLIDQRLWPKFGPGEAAKRAGPAGAGSGTGKAPAQGELRLERVKVVRNDLSDSDRGLVELRPKAAKAKAGAGGSGKGAFFRLAAVRGLFGLFGANRM